MKTHNNHPQWYNQPLRLNEEQTNNPALIFDDFFQCYHLNEVRETMWQWMVAVVSSAGSISDNYHERNNHMYFYEKMEALVEAVWVMQRGSGQVAMLDAQATTKRIKMPVVNSIKDEQPNRFTKPVRLIEKANSQPSEVIREVFSEVTWNDLHEYLLPAWLRVAIVSKESPYSAGDGREILYAFYDQLLLFVEALHVLFEGAPGYKPTILNEEQLACPTQVVTDFFRQCTLEYVRRELCDFLDAGIGYDGNYPNGFTPWQAWMTYNQVLCLVEAGWWLYGGQQEQTGASILVQQESATDVLIA